MTNGVITMKKPTWVVQKERNKRINAAATVWIFGLHAVRDALLNPKRIKLRLILTKNSLNRLKDVIFKPDLLETCDFITIQVK